MAVFYNLYTWYAIFYNIYGYDADVCQNFSYCYYKISDMHNFVLRVYKIEVLMKCNSKLCFQNIFKK
jgi:hypothetical protein